MNLGKIVSWAIIGLCFIACAGYLWVADWRRASYWFFCGCLFISVTV